jgi:hypothetical protein
MIECPALRFGAMLEANGVSIQVLALSMSVSERLLTNT